MNETTAPPRDYASLRDLLVARRDAMPKRLAQVAAFAVAHPDEIAFGTAASVAAAAEVQPSTLVRFAQAIGFSGFTDLQAVFRERLRERLPSYGERLAALAARSDDPLAPAAVLLSGFSDAAIRSAEALKTGLDPQLLTAAIDALAPAETIYLIGQRRSYAVSAYMAYAFGRLGVRYALTGAAAGVDAEPLAFAGERDALLAVSFAPYAPATLAHVSEVAQRGVPVVAITDSPFSPLAQLAKVWFEVAEADFEGFRSLAASFVLAMTLTVGVAERRRAA